MTTRRMTAADLAAQDRAPQSERPGPAVQAVLSAVAGRATFGSVRCPEPLTTRLEAWPGAMIYTTLSTPTGRPDPHIVRVVEMTADHHQPDRAVIDRNRSMKALRQGVKSLLQLLNRHSRNPTQR
jgi:hypothetical protein